MNAAVLKRHVNRQLDSRGGWLVDEVVHVAARPLRQGSIPRSAAARALAWIRGQELPDGGIRVHSRAADAYPEVTGYLVPTLLEVGECELAHRLLRWLLSVQRGNGAFSSPDGEPHVFDSGQVLRGLLAAGERSTAVGAARRTAEFLVAQAIDGGRGGFGSRYRGGLPESVHLYVLPPLATAAETLGQPQWARTALACADYYAAHPEALRLETLTHFLAYELEALIDLGRAELAIPVLDALEREQAADGSVRAFAGARWVCTPGVAQLAVCWLKVGHPEPALRALAWLESRQLRTGGFRGSYGSGAAYFAGVALPWAAKYYLDAYRLSRVATVERSAPPALAATLARLGDVLEVGVGAEPAERLPMAAGSVDAAVVPDALLHSPNPEAVVSEVTRIVRPGGHVYAVAPQGEMWVRTALGRGCDAVSSEPLGDGLTLWRARRRLRLSGAEWHDVLFGPSTHAAVVHRLRTNHVSEWGQAVAAETMPGERVLEIGSGTGEISLRLALSGRVASALDVSDDSLEFQRRCAEELGVTLETVLADATERLPFGDDAFDCVWSSGLLEHFAFDERVAMLREWSRVGRRVLSLVPNAASVAYRAGKRGLEEDGRWSYGIERPICSLRADYEAAGIRIEREFTVGAAHALTFLPRRHPLRLALGAWLRRVGPGEAESARQGYLIVTVGTRRGVV